jgi:two-component system, chemotaxis family, CheB/CheR fusion protein
MKFEKPPPAFNGRMQEVPTSRASMKNDKNQSSQTSAPHRKRQKKTSHQPEPAQPKGLTVVGIGASAGGLKALQEFFTALPGDTGLVFVVVTHLAPEHESHMAEILQNDTQMPVRQVSGKVDVEPNNVYVIPPNREIFITDSRLDLEPFNERRGSRTPVDHFFRSLAHAHHGAIGIILSGGGTDGAVGIKAIKEEGGLLMVQHPDEAEYESMPRAAIATGLVDVVLGVRELAAKLIDYISYMPQIPNDPDLLTQGQQELVQRILEQVQVRTGHDFSQYKRSTILRRIKRRMQLTGQETLESYLAHMRDQPLEASSMFNDILISVTNFFRDAQSWQALAERVIPAILERKQKDEPVRAWTIGCATGEEAYTLAILFAELRARLQMNFPIQIFASDLDEASLIRAREGLYPAAIETDVSRERLERFFHRHGSHYEVRRELRDMVLFANHSVLRDPPFSRVDLISCRNLLIYLQPEMQQNVFDIFHYALNQGGYLFLGSAESAETANELFRVLDKEHRLYQARLWRGQYKHIPSLPLTIRLPRGTGLPRYLRPQFPRMEEIPKLEGQYREALEAHAPPSILVDENNQILYLSETAGRYLLIPKGALTADLLRQVRPELHLELRAALFHAFNTGKTVLTKPVAVAFNGHARRVAISIRLQHGEDERSVDALKQALVFFLEDETTELAPEKDASEAYHQDERNQALISQLEADVNYLREQLQAVTEEYESSNEEMKASNEELQSINEEYRSTAEELETSKEELQSVNEELQTVNNELKIKLDEISRAHSDLENLMSATEIALLFLDRELRIQRYTSGMGEVFNLLPTDKGRPISHLTSKLAYGQIVADAKQVLRELVPLEREISTVEGQWFLVRLRPYHTTDDHIDGVVIGVVDITAIKKAERTQQNYASFYTLFHSNPIPTILTRLEDSVVMNVNNAFLNFLGIQREDVVGHTAREFNLGLDLESKDRAGLATRLLKDHNIQKFDEEIALPTGKIKTVLTSLQYINIEETDTIISTFIDITERVQAERQIRQLSIELASVEQDERYRISQILHDDLQQRVFAVKMQLDHMQERLEEDGLQSVKADFAKLEEWLAEAINITRQLSSDLSPLSLKGEELPEVILWLASQMKEQYGLEVALDLDDFPISLENNLKVVLYHAVRELLFNVVKHAGTLQASVSVKQVDPGFVRVIVSDGGVGFDPESVAQDETTPHGLLSIRHRLSLYDCVLKVESKAGQGARAVIDCPLMDLGSAS